MEYVFVGDRPYRKSGPDEFLQAAIRITGNTLVSMFDAYKSNRFGLKTVSNFASELENYKAELDEQSIQAKLFVDSGGYSIIKGMIPPDETSAVVECYVQFLKNYGTIPDYIFSLDIPFSLKYDEINTKSFIQETNRLSLAETLSQLDQFPACYDKFYFVWHFKMREQYEIWDELFREFNLSSKVSNYAIGGLVGMRKSVHGIDVAPFSSIAFRCFLDHLQGSKSHKPLRLHFLGINLPQDRFQIALLEKLFISYQDKLDVTCTYDSISYMRESIYKSTHGNFFHFSGTGLDKYSYASAPCELINYVLNTDSLRDKFQYELAKLSTQTRKDNYYVFAPLEAYSEIEIDKYLQSLFSEELIAAFKLEHMHAFAAAVIEPIRNKLRKAPAGVFNASCINEICNNLSEAYILFRLLHGENPSQSINAAIGDHIKLIDFPGKLK